jgi:predicted transcriptional regulator
MQPESNFIPFEGILGDTSELRIIQGLLTQQDLTLEELSEQENIDEHEIGIALQNLVRYEVLERQKIKQTIDYNGHFLETDSYFITYKINDNFLEVFRFLNSLIIEQILGPEELDRMTKCKKEKNLGRAYLYDPYP